MVDRLKNSHVDIIYYAMDLKGWLPSNGLWEINNPIGPKLAEAGFTFLMQKTKGSKVEEGSSKES